MAFKRVASKETIEISIGELIEQMSVNLPIYADIQLFIEKGTKLTWHQIKGTFADEFKEDLEDRQVYLSIQQWGLYKVACKYPAFLCADIISWIVSHSDEQTMALSSASGQKLATFKAEDFQQMYHLPKPV